MAYEAEYAAVNAARDRYGDSSSQHYAALAALREAQGNPVMAALNRIAAQNGVDAAQQATALAEKTGLSSLLDR